MFSLLSERVRSCRLCPGLNLPNVSLGAPGFGNLNSPIILVGQSLCARCMNSQEPFDGGCGLIVEEALRLAGRMKKELFITNAIHCHPPGNRPSYPHEIRNCRQFLLAEIETVNARIIVALGEDATSTLISSMNWRGLVEHFVPWNDRLVYPMVHPSYARRLGREFLTGYKNRLAAVIRMAFLEASQTGTDATPSANETGKPSFQ